jgi:serine/threonine protein kinase
VVALIGTGGMGEVYKARDSRLDRAVAIKVLSPQLASDSEFQRRFEREARTVAQLTHPHICTLHDVGHQDGVDYLVMECLEGETLASRLERGRTRHSTKPLKTGIEIVDALDKAHRAGITHRDLKPSNVMLTKRARVTRLRNGEVRPPASCRRESVDAAERTAEPHHARRNWHAPLHGAGTDRRPGG